MERRDFILVVDPGILFHEEISEQPQAIAAPHPTLSPAIGGEGWGEGERAVESILRRLVNGSSLMSNTYGEILKEVIDYRGDC